MANKQYRLYNNSRLEPLPQSTRLRTPQAGAKGNAPPYRASLLRLLGVGHVAAVLGHLLRADLGGGQRVERAAELLDLRRDPGVRVAEPLLEGGRRRPAQHLLDEGVVRVAAADALGAGDVLDGQRLAAKLEDKLGHLVHRDHLVRADVERLLVVRHHQPQDALHRVVDVAEGARLLAVAPHLELLLRGDRLAAEGGRRLLAAALPRAARAVDVVEAADARLVRVRVRVRVKGEW
eukprot:scaffold51468_cov56-Phaeocystis_antarctica.AAC.4